MSDPFMTPWTVACQAPLSMEFPRQECWSELPLSSPSDLPTLGIEPGSPALAGGFFTTAPPGKPIYHNTLKKLFYFWFCGSYRDLCPFLLKVKSESEIIQLCPTLWDPIDCSLWGSSIHGIFQARVMEWVAISFSRDLPGPGIEPRSPTLQADAFTIWATREAPIWILNYVLITKDLYEKLEGKVDNPLECRM